MVPLLFRGLWFWYSLHLQSAPSYAILMNRIRSCLLTRFVHSDRLSAPARNLFCLYCIISGKKLPPQKSRFLGGSSKKIFRRFSLFLPISPQKGPFLGGKWGFGKGLVQPGPCGLRRQRPPPPLWLQLAERKHENGTKDIFEACGARPRSGACGLRRQ